MGISTWVCWRVQILYAEQDGGGQARVFEEGETGGEVEDVEFVLGDKCMGYRCGEVQ